MVTVEGVARRVDPGHNLWAAAEPVVRRWITRELSPPARAREFAREGLEALRGIAKLAETAAAPAVVAVTAPAPRANRLVWFAVGALTSGLAFAVAAALLRH
jgi:ubiquinone biosynthesis protein